ncbi:MAG: DUF5939 domain-containing protein, partial [Pyrinomonadaceae bacterium]
AQLSHLDVGGTLLTYEIWARPNSLLGFLTIPIQIGVRSKQQFAKAFRNYDQIANAETAVPQDEPAPELPSVVRHRLQTLREKLVADSSAPSVVDRLIDLIERGDDFSLTRIRPYALADQWNEPRRVVLETCLRATRTGLLDLQWDLLCPLCRGANASETSLREISTQVHCETCRIDFTVNFDRFVEVTFRPNASLRIAEVKDYCIGSPQRTPHVVVQQLLLPGATRTVNLPLEEGRYRLRALELPGEQLVTVSGDGKETAVVRLSQNVSGDELKLTPQSTLQLENATDAEQLFILERLQWSDQAATAAEVTALQIVRDLFSSEALRPGDQRSVGTLTVLFTD